MVFVHYWCHIIAKDISSFQVGETKYFLCLALFFIVPGKSDLPPRVGVNTGIKLLLKTELSLLNMLQ